MEGEKVCKPYREVVGSLKFLATVSRPDIAYLVNFLSRFLNNYNKSHWDLAIRVLRYLKGSSKIGIAFRKVENFKITGYCDSDYAGDTETRRSTPGYVFMLRQRIVALSTNEAEYISASLMAREVIWLKRLLMDIGRLYADPIVLQIDNQGAIRLAKNLEFSKRTKHIDVQYHYTYKREA